MAPHIDDSESDSEGPKRPARRPGDDLSGNEVLASHTRTQVARKPSAKVATNNKENYDAAQERVRVAEKALLKLKKKAGAMDLPDVDNGDGFESEELDDVDPSGTGFPSSITPLGWLPVAPVRTKPPIVVRKTKKAASTDTPKMSSTAFKHLPELARDQRDQHNRSAPPSPGTGANDLDFDSDDANPMYTPSDPPSPSQLHSPRGRAEAAGAGDKRQRPGSSSPPPPAKCSKHKVKVKELQFCEGFVLVQGVKPKSADYAPEEEALLLRSAFPPAPLQYQWAKECFSNSCRSASVRYGITDRITDRMVKVITLRGSQIRGKMVDSYRLLFETHYKFTKRANSKAVIAANKLKASALLHKSSFHYKDPENRIGYAGNSIIATARTQIIFKDRQVLAAVFSSYFNPTSGTCLALDFSLLQHLAQEWSTGIHSYVEKWIKLNPTVTENLRRKWYKRASQHYALDPVEESHIDGDDENFLRSELEGKTGDTDSEEELEVEGDA
ncbi:hypothetical protein DFH06DRAFT_1340423 [Mycena polygramma]|nr:hypothetical protein DFH06DRAFT_1340423 [Mycena polygramma]